MDNYPEHLAPEFDEGGGVKTPFEEWWSHAREHFAHVPEDVARYWLHEHWSHSPFQWLPSKDYRFKLVKWPSSEMPLIRSGWTNWSEDHAECLEQGCDLVEKHHPAWEYPTVRYLLEHGDFPTPIVVLDNRDGHLKQGQGDVPEWEALPETYILIEGHRRFNIALYLHATQRIQPSVSVWLMEADRRP
jgi:hypothetical protein